MRIHPWTTRATSLRGSSTLASLEPQADLHTHTLASDGTMTPEELVDDARIADLAAIALTDHDTIDGVTRAQIRGAEIGVEVIPGVELSSNDGEGGSDIHILGLFIDIGSATLAEHLSMLRHEREVRVTKIVSKLRSLDVHLEDQEVLDLAGTAPPGRVHVAEALLRRGLVRTLDEAFKRYLGDRSPAYVAKGFLSPERAVALVRETGGVPIFAHPGPTNKDNRLVELVAHGLLGVEVFCPYHYPKTAERYASLAVRHGLLVSGGSDFHGARKENARIGASTVPMRFVEQIRSAAGSSMQTGQMAGA